MREFSLLFVPAVIAFAMVGSVLYIVITDPGRPVPELLTNSIATILGYYFGIGVTAGANEKIDTTALQELRTQIEALAARERTR